MQKQMRTAIFLSGLILLFSVFGCEFVFFYNDASEDPPPPVPPQTYPARRLPARFIAATAFTSGSYATASERAAFVRETAEKARLRGVQAVNLVVDWWDVAPVAGALEFELLEEMILAIKSRGLYCILRVYANVEGHWQAWPSWLDPIDTYAVRGETEILPWDPAYQRAWESFLERLAARFITGKAQPDAVQITLGGSFGEQVLGGYDSSGWEWPTFTDRLFEAEKWHVEAYLWALGDVAKSHIVMVNSLVPTIPEYEDEVCLYAWRENVAWAQSNAGACFLTGATYGPANARMLARAYDRGSKIVLEDESGNWSCPQVGLSSALSDRVAYMRGLQETYGFIFSAVSIGTDDLDDLPGLSALKRLLGS